MAKIYPFRGTYPLQELAKDVIAPPYDVLSRAEAKEIVAAGADPLRGMADVRWILMNCNEFRFLP